MVASNNRRTSTSVSESGQALILLMLVIVVLIGFAALSIDGGRLLTERRRAQNAVDAAAMAAAVAKCDGGDMRSAGLLRAESNGYDNNGSTNTVALYHPPSSGPYAGNLDYIEVTITSSIANTLAQVVYSGPLEVTVRAVSHCFLGITGAGGAIFAASESCQNSIDWSGSSTTIKGGVHSNNDVHVGGQTNLIIGGNVTYIGSLDAPPDKITYEPPSSPKQIGVLPYPVHFRMDDYVPTGAKASSAGAVGKYYQCDCKMDKGWLESNGLYNDGTKILQDGLYYTTDDIDLSASDILGNAVTFVARGKISFSGSTHTLRPYIDGLLAFTDLQPPGNSQCDSAVVKMAGSTHDWAGIIFAPNGLIEMSGSSNTTLNGSLIANTVRLNGSLLEIQYESVLLPAGPLVELAE